MFKFGAIRNSLNTTSLLFENTAKVTATRTQQSIRSQTDGARSRRRERVFVNEVRLLGRVGNNPELRGKSQNLATFPMCTSAFWTSADGEEKERTDWHRIIIASPNLRDRVMDFVSKGDRVMVFGEIQYSFTENPNGYRVPSTYIKCSRLLNVTPGQRRDRDTTIVDEDVTPEDIAEPEEQFAEDATTETRV